MNFQWRLTVTLVNNRMQYTHEAHEMTKHMKIMAKKVDRRIGN